ncbi:alpha-L-fucosidase [Dinghuibacter silviterrae]|uniref:alpha-L-fucosidase n=1 Tax=Dinghuibacter silviterrae TaxID=1539049 RepID=A0A4R8DGS1_9BACT|nr:alpha-L-fucosidase [Dinghuibacter silviterrae]TDW96879.1 alpha-L-fucosidase [Dinghuibacter silviterrae]
MKNIAFSLVLALSVCSAAAQPYGQIRDGLHRPGEQMTVAFLGGSITYNPGWREKVCDYLRTRWPQTTFRFIAAGIPSLGSVPHAFRLQQDVLDSGKVDLLFVETAVNDRVNGTDSLLQVRALEGIIRHARLSNPAMDIVMMAFADPDKTKDYTSGRTPVEVANQELVAGHYRLPSANIAYEVYDHLRKGEFSWEKDFKDIHPAPFGQELYFQSIRRLLEACWVTKAGVAPQGSGAPGPAPRPLDPANLSEGQYVPVYDAAFDSTWTLSMDWTPADSASTRKGFVHVPVLSAVTPGATLTLAFRGTAAGIAVLSGPDAGAITYSIDDGPARTMNLYTQWSSWLHLPWYEVLGSGLEEGQHLLKVTIADNNDPRSKGHSVRIAHFLVNGPPASTPKKDVADFMRQRFGLFIHWGPVTLRGTEIGWSRGREVPTEEYDTLYKEFDPALFNADAWVAAAKAAGMHYLTIVAKHHDGFCLWPTAYSDFNIMHTPFKRDVVGELAEACRKQHIHFCIYSTVLDWHDKDYGPNMPAFVARMKGELKELITHYHPYMLWFDGYWEKPWTMAYAREVYAYIKSLDPDVVVNNRLGKDPSTLYGTSAVGDFLTPEQEIGRLNMVEPWESCITIATQWAWKPNDKVKTLAECIHALVRTAAGNGNLLLNISPMPDGRFEAREATRIREVGEWLSRYGSSIYDTKGGPYTPNDVYASTRKGKLVYIHLMQRPSDTLTLPALAGARVLRAYWMGGGEQAFQQGDNLIFPLPKTLPDPNSAVLVLALDTDAEQLPLVHDQHH